MKFGGKNYEKMSDEINKRIHMVCSDTLMKLCNETNIVSIQCLLKYIENDGCSSTHFMNGMTETDEKEVNMKLNRK